MIVTNCDVRKCYCNSEWAMMIKYHITKKLVDEQRVTGDKINFMLKLHN